MKRILLAGITMLSSLITIAQTDTTGTGNKGDTVFVGNFIIIRNGKEKNTYHDSLPPKREDYTIINIPGTNSYHEWKEENRKKNISTNYLIFDLGFANYNDKTDYDDPQTAAYVEPGVGKHDLKLITGKSSNVNIWLFMQRLNLSRHVWNLKYGFGLNMYNYRYSSNISFRDSAPYIYHDTIDFSKNKLYADYLTIPVMINVTPSPNHRHGFNASAGISVSYRIGTHSKQISEERGKVKDHDDFSLAAWQIAYVAEMGLGPIRIYGSYSMSSLYDEGIKQYPYTIGLRFSNW